MSQREEEGEHTSCFSLCFVLTSLRLHKCFTRLFAAAPAQLCLVSAAPGGQVNSLAADVVLCLLFSTYPFPVCIALSVEMFMLVVLRLMMSNSKKLTKQPSLKTAAHPLSAASPSLNLGGL